MIFLSILFSVAFITILERKVMGSMQRRLGPNYVGWYGLLQPIADALKLILKETIIPQDAYKILFILGPIISLVLSLLLWGFVPITPEVFIYDYRYSILANLAIGSLSVYGIILAGWSANSKYTILGSIRSIAQVLSYELILSTCFLIILLLNKTLNFINVMISQLVISNIFIFIPIFIIYFISILAETNRTPFDLPEAESELVSGFQTEHSAVVFVYFFLAEYSNILYWSTITGIIFFSGISPSYLGLKSSIFVILFIWVRATLPRLKYNQLIYLCWYNLIPWVFSLLILISIIGIN